MCLENMFEKSLKFYLMLKKWLKKLIKMATGNIVQGPVTADPHA